SEPQRIDLVQRLEFALRIPPAVGQLTEFLEFDRIDIDHFQAAFRSTFRRGYALATLRPCAGVAAGPGARGCEIRPDARRDHSREPDRVSPGSRRTGRRIFQALSNLSFVRVPVLVRRSEWPCAMQYGLGRFPRHRWSPWPAAPPVSFRKRHPDDYCWPPRQ